MTEVMEAMIPFLREKGFKILTARTHPDNIASKRVLEKNKFIFQTGENDQQVLHYYLEG